MSPGPGDSQQIVLEVRGDSFHYFRGSSATGGSSKIESPWGLESDRGKVSRVPGFFALGVFGDRGKV